MTFTVELKFNMWQMMWICGLNSSLDVPLHQLQITQSKDIHSLYILCSLWHILIKYDIHHKKYTTSLARIFQKGVSIAPIWRTENGPFLYCSCGVVITTATGTFTSTWDCTVQSICECIGSVTGGVVTATKPGTGTVLKICEYIGSVTRCVVITAAPSTLAWDNYCLT